MYIFLVIRTLPCTVVTSESGVCMPKYRENTPFLVMYRTELLRDFQIIDCTLFVHSVS